MATAGFKGIQETINELRKFGKDIEKQINAETEAIAFQIEGDAKEKAPANFGKLRQSISKEKRGSSSYAIMVNEMYGAYMEFGTGAKVKVPAEFKELADPFKQKTGKTFEQGLESIKVWCKAKGIDEKFAYVIFVAILTNGLEPQPFLYPAYKKGEKDYLKNLNNLLKNISVKI